MSDWLTVEEGQALALSVKIACWTIVFSLPVATCVAWILARLRFPGKVLLDGLVHLPLVLPPVVVGYTLLLVFGKRGPVGAWLDQSFGASLAFTWQGAVLAAAVMAFPLMVRAIRLSLEAIDPGLEQAARTLGAGRLKLLFTITLPLAAPGLVAGALLGFARAVGEFGATITFVSNIPGVTQTLPLALYAHTEVPGGEDAALRLAILSILLAFIALGASELLARRLKAKLGNSESKEAR